MAVISHKSRRAWASIIALALVGFLCAHRAHAATACSSAANGTVQTLSYLYTQEFVDGQAAGSITPGCMRDLVATVGQGNIGIELDFFMSGVPGASAALPKVFSRATIIPASAAIKCNALAGATASTTVTLKKNASSIGTLVFAASGSANQGCTVTFSSQVSFAAGDLLITSFPASADATLANIDISIPALQ